MRQLPIDYYLSLPSRWCWTRTRKHFPFRRWHTGTCGQQMAIENSAGKRGFLFSVDFSPLASTVPSNQNARDTSAVWWTVPSTTAGSSGTSKGSVPANSMKQHFTMHSFPGFPPRRELPGHFVGHILQRTSPSNGLWPWPQPLHCGERVSLPGLVFLLELCFCAQRQRLFPRCLIPLFFRVFLLVS